MHKEGGRKHEVGTLMQSPAATLSINPSSTLTLLTSTNDCIDTLGHWTFDLIKGRSSRTSLSRNDVLVRNRSSTSRWMHGRMSKRCGMIGRNLRSSRLHHFTIPLAWMAIPRALRNRRMRRDTGHVEQLQGWHRKQFVATNLCLELCASNSKH